MTTVDALQTALEAEHAALFVYGVLGAQTSQSATPELFSGVSDAYAAHRSRRDHLTRLVLDAGEAPVAAEAAYKIPKPLGKPVLVARAALEIERAASETYAWLVANTVATERRWAITALTDAAVRELMFRGSPEIFPGAHELADRR